MEATGPLGFQCQVSLSSMQESEQNEHHLNCSHGILPFLSLSGTSTCIQQSASDGFFHNEDCWQFSNFVCELNRYGVFAEPPEGIKSGLYCDYTFTKNDTFQKVTSILKTTPIIIQITMAR